MCSSHTVYYVSVVAVINLTVALNILFISFVMDGFFTCLFRIYGAVQLKRIRISQLFLRRGNNAVVSYQLFGHTINASLQYYFVCGIPSVFTCVAEIVLIANCQQQRIEKKNNLRRLTIDFFVCKICKHNNDNDQHLTMLVINYMKRRSDEHTPALSSISYDFQFEQRRFR